MIVKIYQNDKLLGYDDVSAENIRKIPSDWRTEISTLEEVVNGGLMRIDLQKIVQQISLLSKFSSNVTNDEISSLKEKISQVSELVKTLEATLQREKTALSGYEKELHLKLQIISLQDLSVDAQSLIKKMREK